MKLHFIFALAILIKYAGAECETTFNDISVCDQCAGTCDSFNGCFCADGLKNCLPGGTISCTNLNLCCPAGLYYNQTAPCCTKEVICADTCAADQNCTLGTCVCNGAYYKNSTIDDFHPTIVCENTVITIAISECQLDTLGYDPSTIHLRDSTTCASIYTNITNNQKMLYVQTQTASTWCGNTVEGDNSNIYVYNTIYIGIKNTPIITKNPIQFNYTCGYKRNMQTSLLLPGNITTQTQNLTGINGIGSYPVKMTAYKDSDYSIPFQIEDAVVVGSDIFIGMFVEGTDADIYVLRVETCIASPTANRNGPNSFALIENGCAVNTYVSTDIKENGNSSEVRFRTSAFQFQNEPSVNIICDVRLCERKTGSCGACVQTRSSSPATKELKVGLNLEDKLDLYDAGRNTVASWALLAGIQAAIVFIKFF